MAVVPVPSNRSSDLLVRSRLMYQLQQHQLDILRVQNRLATGMRLSKPSEDSPAASRAVRMQMMLEQREQAAANLTATSSYLSASDAALAQVASTLIDIRGLAVSVNNSTSSASEREAAVRQIRQSVDQLMRVGNHEFRGRYLFAGSRAGAQPFDVAGRHVVYQGNEKTLASLVDLDLLQDAGLPADSVFGVYSGEVRGTADLNPIVTEDTRLADLNGGAGASTGNLIVSDGTSSVTVDIRSAVTLGDVVRLIESSPPEGRRLIARVTRTGLSIDLDDALGGNLAIRDETGGSTARELGIANSAGTGVQPIVGSDLNPRLSLNTRLDELLGARASGILRSDGWNNDVVIEAVERGAEQNGLSVQLVDDSLTQAASGIDPGAEYAEYSATAVAARAALTFSGFNNNLVLTAKAAGADLNQTRIEIVDAGAIGNDATIAYDADNGLLTIGIDALGQTQVQTVIQRLDALSPFTAAYDDSVASDGGYVPTALISAADVGAVAGNTGNSGGDAGTVFVRVSGSGSTANQVVAAIEAAPDVAALVRAWVDEKDTAVAASEGEGIVDADAAVELDGGAGIEFDQASGFQIVNGGTTYSIDVSAAETIEDLLNAINGSGANVVATINDAADGIDVRSALSGAEFAIGENGGETAAQLGIRTLTEATLLSDLNHGLGVNLVAGTAFTIVRNDGTELDVDLSDAATIGDVLARINDHASNQDAARVTARLAEFGNGIELVDEADEGVEELAVRKGLGGAAWDLGLVPRGGALSESAVEAQNARAIKTFPAPNDADTGLVFTVLPPGSSGNGIVVQFTDSGAVSGDTAVYAYDALNRVLTVDIDSAATTANGVVAAFSASTEFAVDLDMSTDPANDGTGLLGGTGPNATTEGGVAASLQGADVHTYEVEGVFNTLIKLADALESSDSAQVERTVGLLLDDLDRLSYARSEMGARGRFLDAVKVRMEDEMVQTRELLSNEVDADAVATISELTQKQAAFQAALQLIARVFQMSLLDFI